MPCLICYKKVKSHPRRDPTLNLFSSSRSSKTAKKCNKSFTDSWTRAVSKDLSAIFVLRMLGIPSEFSESLIFSSGNPSSWNLTFCPECRSIIEEAHVISEKIRRLIQEFHELAKNLKQITLESFEDDRNTGPDSEPEKSISPPEAVRTWFYNAQQRQAEMWVKPEPFDQIDLPVDFDFKDDTTVNKDVPIPKLLEPETNEKSGRRRKSTVSKSIHLNQVEVDSDEGDFDNPPSPEWKPSESDDTDDDMESKLKGGVNGNKNSSTPKSGDNDSDGDIKCPLCCRHFKTPKVLDAHILRAHYGMPNPFTCDLCDMAFQTMSRLVVHQNRVHEGVTSPILGDDDEDSSGLVEDNGISLNKQEISPEDKELLEAIDESRKLACGECNFRFKSKLHLAGHVRVKHQGMTGMECPRCEKTFNRYCSLLEHCQSHLLKSAYHSCTEKDCTKFFKSLLLRDAHIDKEHLGVKLAYRCTRCPKKFGNMKSLFAHMRLLHNTTPGSEESGVKKRTHTINKLPTAFKCSKCHNRFPSRLSMEAHLRAVHSDGQGLNPLHPCTDSNCKRTFLDEENLKRHVLLSHTPADERELQLTKKAIVCNDCGMTFIRDSALRTHRQKRHPLPEEKKRFMCEICSRSFTIKPYLDDHQKAEHFQQLGLTPHKCPECGKVCISERSVRDHMKRKHIKKDYRFYCNVCSRGFLYEHRRNDHLRIYHSQAKDFKCSLCSKAFKTDSYLKKHLVTHSSVKPFNCSVCSKAFSDSSTYKRHMEIHSSVVHKCPLPSCLKEFKVRHTFKLHLKTHSATRNLKPTPAKKSRSKISRKKGNGDILSNVSDANNSHTNSVQSLETNSSNELSTLINNSMFFDEV